MMFFIDKFREFRLCFFVLLCCVLGGTSQAVLEPKLVLYIISILMIGWTVSRVGLGGILRKSKILNFSILGFFVLGLFQLLPLPPKIWSSLSGREAVIDGYELMGLDLPWLPLTLTPNLTVLSLANFLPAMAAYLICVHLSNRKEQSIAIWGFLLFCSFTVVLGLAQTSGVGSLYFYDITNAGLPVGFFSNSNHQATLLLMGTMLAFSYGYKFLFGDNNRANNLKTQLVILILLLTIFVVGLILNTSLAGYSLLAFGLLLSVLTFPFGRGIQVKPAGMFLMLVVFSLAGYLLFDAFFAMGPDENVASKLMVDGQMSRGHVYLTTMNFMSHYFPFGGGLGSYPEIYRLYEDPNLVSNVYLPHAHNDYLEILVDFGLAAFVLVLVFFSWWLRMFSRSIKAGQKASSIGKGAALGVLMVLMHSLVDYPLRTIAIGASFGFFLGLMVRRQV